MSHLLKNAYYSGAGQFLYLNEELSDVSIIVNNNGLPWRFPAHSLFLSAQSAVFRCMLENDFLEKSSCNIIIDDIYPTTVESLLRYLYYGRLNIENWKEAIDLLKAAHKYQIDSLVQKCGKFLENVITVTNVCYVYNAAAIYSLLTLKEKCLKLILDAGFVVLRSKVFITLSKESVIEIVANSNLNVDSELTVFDALLQWAPMECCRTGKQVTETNILLELQPFLEHVCFDDMSDTDKSALPPSILSCVKPNNRNRIGFSVPETLLPHSKQLHFFVYQEFFEFVGDSLSCMRFSVDSSIYLIGMDIIIMASDIPHHFPLYLVKENVGKSTVFTFNLASATWREGLLINERRKRYETQILLRQPVCLEEKTVYKLYCIDRGQDIQCPRSQLQNDTVFTSAGHVVFSLHCEEIWGVSSLIFI